MHKIAHFQYVNIHFAKFESKGMKALGVTTRHPKSVADEQTNGGTGRWSGPTTRPAFAKAMLKKRNKHYLRARICKHPDVRIHCKRCRAHVQKVLKDAHWNYS